MERITSHDITQLRNTASRNRASGVLDGDRPSVAGGAGPIAPAPSDHGRSRLQLAALERVRKARLAVAEAEADIERTIALLEMLGDRPRGAGDEEPGLPPGVDPVDAERLDQVHADLERARRRSSRRGGGREVLSLEMTERLILERLGYPDYDAFDSARRRRETPVLDFAHLEFAQHELAEAEAAWEALLDGAPTRAGGPVAGPAPLPVWQGPGAGGPAFGEVAGFADDLGIADVPTLDEATGHDEAAGGDGDGVALLEELAADGGDLIGTALAGLVDGGEPIELGPAVDPSPAQPADQGGHGLAEASGAAPSGGAPSDGPGRPLPRRVPRTSPAAPSLPRRVRRDRRAAS